MRRGCVWNPQGGRRLRLRHSPLKLPCGAFGISPPSGGRCRGATEGGRACVGWLHTQPRRCGRTPPSAYGISPPRGGENWDLRHSPLKLPCGAFGISPPSGGRCRGATEGGRACVGWLHTQPRRCGRTPLCLRHLPPRGEKIGAGGICPSRGALGLRRFSSGGEHWVGGDWQADCAGVCVHPTGWVG